MIIKKEERLADFEFWSGACFLADKLTEDDFSTVESFLEENFPDGMTDTEINDFFWFDGDVVAQILGYEDEDGFYKSRGL